MNKKLIFNLIDLPITPCQPGLDRLGELGYRTRDDLCVYELLTHVESPDDASHVDYITHVLNKHSDKVDFSGFAPYSEFEDWLDKRGIIEYYTGTFLTKVENMGIPRFRIYYKQFLDDVTCGSSPESRVDR